MFVSSDDTLVILMGRHTLFQTVVQGYRVTAKYAKRALKSEGSADDTT